MRIKIKFYWPSMSVHIQGIQLSGSQCTSTQQCSGCTLGHKAKNKTTSKETIQKQQIDNIKCLYPDEWVSVDVTEVIERGVRVRVSANSTEINMEWVT